MLALLNWFRRSYPGWSKLTTLEGVSVLFQENAKRTSSNTDNPYGRFTGTTYSASGSESTFSTMLIVRDYTPGQSVPSEERFTSWKAEFKHAMQVYEVSINLVKEQLIPGQHPRCDLLFTNHDETVYTRVSLIAQEDRLVILFACGMLQEVSGPACSECFRSIRV